MQNMPEVGAIQFDGKPLWDNAIDKIVSADIEMGVDQVTELTIKFDDPAFQLLGSKTFDLNTPVRYRGLHMHIAVIETNPGGGLGELGIRCRPTAVRKLKMLRGKKVRNDITPAAYLASECELAQVSKRPVAQDSKAKKKIARDVAESGMNYDPASEPSAWTTIQRLASEIGFVVYEVGGVIYFGKPTWLVERQPNVVVQWYPSEGKEPFSIPQIRKSVDSKDVEVTLELPLRRSGEVIPGKGLRLEGFPKFSDTYFINTVSYPLAGRGNKISVTASTVRDPEKQQAISVGVPSGTTRDYDGIKGVRNLARAIAADEYGWGDTQFAALDKLWQKESGWDYKAYNTSSGATGIPQALPGNKMASEGADWKTNPETQIRWGLKYIKDRYGSPVAAWNHSVEYNWY
jgi:hypothetical protein